MLEEVKRVFSRFEIDFKSGCPVGLDFLVVGAHVEHDLLLITGLHVLLLNGPENQHVNGQFIGQHHLALCGVGQEALEPEVQAALRE